MYDQIKYHWQQAVVDAFLSLPRDLPAKINIAERTISARLQESCELDLSEQVALDDGLRALHVLVSEASFQPAQYNLGTKEKIARRVRIFRLC